MSSRGWLGLAGLVILGGLFILVVAAIGMATVLSMGMAKVWQDLRAYLRDLSASP